jgi:hypothetical protein
VDGLADEVVRLSQCLAVRLAVVVCAFNLDYRTPACEAEVLLVQNYM